MLKEVTIEIRGFSYTLSRRIEESDLRYLRQDYIPFLILQYQGLPEILFGDEKILEKAKKEFGQNMHTAGEVYIHRPDRKIDKIFLSSSPKSSPSQRKKWLEEVLSRINPMVLCNDIWLSANQKEFYVYDLPLDWHLRNPKIEIFPVIL